MAVPDTPPCPICASEHTTVEEDVSDEVTVYVCDDCATTWADRSDRGAGS